MGEAKKEDEETKTKDEIISLLRSFLFSFFLFFLLFFFLLFSLLQSQRKPNE